MVVSEQPQLDDGGHLRFIFWQILNASVIYLQVILGAVSPQGNSDLAAHGGRAAVLGVVIWTAVALRKRFDSLASFLKRA